MLPAVRVRPALAGLSSICVVRLLFLVDVVAGGASFHGIGGWLFCQIGCLGLQGTEMLTFWGVSLCRKWGFTWGNRFLTTMPRVLPKSAIGEEKCGKKGVWSGLVVGWSGGQKAITPGRWHEKSGKHADGQYLANHDTGTVTPPQKKSSNLRPATSTLLPSTSSTKSKGASRWHPTPPLSSSHPK